MFISFLGLVTRGLGIFLCCISVNPVCYMLIQIFDTSVVLSWVHSYSCNLVFASALFRIRQSIALITSRFPQHQIYTHMNA